MLMHLDKRYLYHLFSDSTLCLLVREQVFREESEIDVDFAIEDVDLNMILFEVSTRQLGLQM